jgi:8-oxo-dGTP diphosphatase
METKLFAATKAFILYQGKVLLVRESSKYADGSNAGSYDVVGGRVTPGERFDESLLREIREETGLTVRIGRPFFVNEWRPVVRGEQWQIIGTFFECFADSSKVVLSGDHSEFIWIDPADFRQYPIIPNLTAAFESYLSR